MFKYEREINQSTLQSEMKTILDAVGNHGEAVLIKSTLRDDIAVVKRSVLDGIILDKKSLELDKEVERRMKAEGDNNNIEAYDDSKPFVRVGASVDDFANSLRRVFDKKDKELKGNSMTNEKLMKIVQAVNDSKGFPIDYHKASYNIVARYRCGEQYEINTVHAVHKSRCSDSWEFVCTVEEFNQCVKEMSAGHGKKESNVKNNKHPHHDLIVEWAKDTAKVVQMKHDDGTWYDNQLPFWSHDREYQFKPREFVKGHWYPCVDGDEVSVNVWDGSHFSGFSNESGCNKPNCYDEIGESLGEIKFGGGE